MTVKVELTYEEIQIIIQYIQALNCPGTEVHRVGLLADKLIKQKQAMETKATQQPQKEKLNG